MQPYLIPRDTKGEGRILYIFSGKALIYTAIGIGLGFPFYKFFSCLGVSIIGWIIMGGLAFVGFAIATFKMPSTSAFEITRKTSGESIDEIIRRTVMFKVRNKNKIYIYKGGKEDE